MKKKYKYIKIIKVIFELYVYNVDEYEYILSAKEIPYIKKS